MVYFIPYYHILRIVYTIRINLQNQILQLENAVTCFIERLKPTGILMSI